MSELTRRDVLRLFSTAGVGALLVPGVTAGSAAAVTVDGMPVDGILDVAVVGGGVAGTYAAWRLLDGSADRSTVLRPLAAHAGGRLAVGLFELSGRLGGRLHSVTPPGMPHLRAEMGGMRFPTTHTIVAKLAEHLQLETRDFPVGQGENLHYLRGRRLRQKEWSLPGVLPYDLAAADRGKTLDDLLIEAIERHVPEARRLDARAWDRLKATARLDGRLLCDHGFWSLLLKAKGIEVFNLIHDSGGYGSFYRSWNAGEMMSWIMADFLHSPAYLTLREGYDSLPREMARRFTGLGGHLLTGHRLLRVCRVAVGGLPLLRLDFTRPDGAPVSFLAHHAVLAMPRRALELLEPDTFLFSSAQFSSDLRSVSPQPAAKIFLGYPQPWWENLGIRAGRSTTDLPLRQCYYFGAEGVQPGANPANRGSLLMASYHEDAEVGYWSTFLAQPPAPGKDPAFPPASSNAASEDLEAPAALVEELHRQVAELHGMAGRIPDPSLALYANWTQDPFGAGWHFWNVHTRPWEVIPRMRQPFPDTNLYLCGEAWSTDQGWVRGALHTAERMLQEKLGLPGPPWLPSDEYLGP